MGGPNILKTSSKMPVSPEQKTQKLALIMQRVPKKTIQFTENQYEKAKSKFHE
jgi:hypothetical protein